MQNSPTEIQTFLALKGLNFEGYDIPGHTQGALYRYVYNRYMPGSFGEAILAGDLEAAKWRADGENAACLLEIDRWICEQLPDELHGSYEKVRAWCYNR